MLARSFAVALAIALSGVTLVACNANIDGGKQPGQGLGSAGGSGLGGAGAVGGAGSVSLGGPGRVVMHRLNHAEYDNTVRDLLGTQLKLSENFPLDDTAYGFDNIASALSMTDVTLAYYVETAKKLAAEALTASRRSQLVSCDLASGKEACVSTVLGAFLPRAWRRPAQPG